MCFHLLQEASKHLQRAWGEERAYKTQSNQMERVINRKTLPLAENISNKIIINRLNQCKYLKAFTTKAVDEVRAM